MKKMMKAWLIATVSTSVGIALGILLAPDKKCKSCSAKNDNADKINGSH